MLSFLYVVFATPLQIATSYSGTSVCLHPIYEGVRGIDVEIHILGNASSTTELVLANLSTTSTRCRDVFDVFEEVETLCSSRIIRHGAHNYSISISAITNDFRILNSNILCIPLNYPSTSVLFSGYAADGFMPTARLRTIEMQSACDQARRRFRDMGCCGGACDVYEELSSEIELSCNTVCVRETQDFMSGVENN